MIDTIDCIDTEKDREEIDYITEDIKYLDENTIDEYFLPQVRDKDGNRVSILQQSYDSPFANQENPGKIEEGASLFRPDAWGTTELCKGVDLYQVSSQDGTYSCYFTDGDTIDACTDSETGILNMEQLKSMLQIYDADASKMLVSKFRVEEDGIKAAIGIASENTEYGLGGGTQYFIPHANEYKESGLISLSGSIDLGEKNDDRI